MYKKSVRIASFIFLATIIFMGCSNSLERDNSTLKKEIAAVKVKKLTLVHSISEAQNKPEDHETQITLVKVTTLQNENNIYSIYTADINTLEKKIERYIYIDSSMTLIQKLDTLTKTLSEVYFGNLPIQVIKIEEVDNKKIAVVNLSESKENQGIAALSDHKGISWIMSYFQGSTGGSITSTQLVETLLQRDYEGQWIDGVRFLYNNEVCDLQHLPELMDINYRK